MAEDRFPPVILAVSLVPANVTVSGRTYVSVEATDAARVSDSEKRVLYLRGGKRLCVRRTSMAVEYELTHTGEQVDAALDAVDGLAELLERVVGTVSDEYGQDVAALIGKPYSTELREAEAIRCIREALTVNPYVSAVDQVSVQFRDSELKVSFSMKTIYGEVTLKDGTISI